MKPLVQQILEATEGALKTPFERRFYATERGYHGRFYCALQASLDRLADLPKEAILEMEYQKSSRHGLAQRPDIVLHIPQTPGVSVDANNYAVFALKHSASRKDAKADFKKLDEMCGTLNYQLAVFINVASEAHHGDIYQGCWPERFCAFSLMLQQAGPVVQRFPPP